MRFEVDVRSVAPDGVPSRAPLRGWAWCPFPDSERKHSFSALSNTLVGGLIRTP